MVCQWFALCTTLTTTAIDHPILGMVPCCERCAQQVGAETELVAIAERD